MRLALTVAFASLLIACGTTETEEAEEVGAARRQDSRRSADKPSVDLNTRTSTEVPLG